MSSGKHTHLHLIHTQTKKSAVRMHFFNKTHDHKEYWQPMLFPELSSHFIIPITFGTISEEYFSNLIVNSVSKYIIDLRIAPRFDYHGLNRDTAFMLFDRFGHKYFDYAGISAAISCLDPRLNPHLLANFIKEKAFKGGNALGAIVLIFEEQHEGAPEYAAILADCISTGIEKWHIRS